MWNSAPWSVSIEIKASEQLLPRKIMNMMVLWTVKRKGTSEIFLLDRPTLCKFQQCYISSFGFVAKATGKYEMFEHQN